MQLRFRNINIELCSACNFDCTYCPEHKMTRKKGLMDYELAVSLLDQMKAMDLTEEINFYHMGESLLHKRAIDIFRGAKRLGFRIHALLDHSDKLFPVIPGFKLNLIKVHTWSNTHVCAKTTAEKPIKKAYSGGCDALSDSMAIFADGSYSLCCVDWDGRVVAGNAHTQPLADFLCSPQAEAIRKGFSHGKFSFDYCRECGGGYTTKDWAFNQVYSFVYHNSSFSEKFDASSTCNRTSQCCRSGRVSEARAQARATLESLYYRQNGSRGFLHECFRA